MNPRVLPAGDAALLLEFDEVIDPVINAQVMAAADAIREARVPGVRDIVPTYRSVTVYFNPLKTDANRLRDLLEEKGGEAALVSAPSRPPVRIPVCYGNDLGPDLQAVADHAGLSAAEVVRLHAAATYRVFMIGFLPGFPYLGLLDSRIAAPRLATPRVRVPAGSVGIAGRQTGIYPVDTPGGWQIIGRTPLKMFDAAGETPCLLKPGDAVQFYAVDGMS